MTKYSTCLIFRLWYIFSDLVRDALSGHFNSVQDRRLQTLVKSLPDVLAESKAKNTQKKYRRGFESWKKWASNFPEVTILPASYVYVCLFLLSLIQDGVSCSIIDEVHYGLKWFHKIAGYEDPCNAAIVLSTLEAAKRLLSTPVHKKEAVTPEIIQLLFEKFGKPSANLSDLRVLLLSVLCYAGFLRFSEMVNLRRHDFHFEDTFMRVFIERSKTDIYRNGAWVVIANTAKSTCPVRLTLRYFDSGQFPPESNQFLFRPLKFLSKTGVYEFRNLSQLSYTRAREIVLSAFDSIGLPKQDYGLHSFRAGGASAAANANIGDRLFKRHGRWRSEKAKDGYVKDNIDSLLSVSRSLGI